MSTSLVHEAGAQQVPELVQPLVHVVGLTVVGCEAVVVLGLCLSTDM